MKNANVHFGTDGWRGILGREFTSENLHRVARALALTFQNKVPPKMQVVVGYDHRFLADKYAHETAVILSGFGFNPLLVPSPVTSPLLSFITWKMKAPFGVMITASHNPPEYLGFKVKGSFGGSISTTTVKEIETHIDQTSEMESGFTWPKLEVKKAPNFMPAYMSYLKGHLDPGLFKKSKQKVVFDALYGPSVFAVQEFFRTVSPNSKLELLHAQRDPTFGNSQPEPIEEYLTELKAAVKKQKANVGFALDGDGDRLGVIDDKGRYLTPQQVFALLFWYFLEHRGKRGKVVQAVSLGYLSQRIAKAYGCEFEEVSVGFKYVAEKLLTERVLIGGEESGGYAFGNEPGSKNVMLPERDGLFSGLLFMEMSLRTGKPVSRLIDELEDRFGTSCYLRKDIALKAPIRDKAEFVKEIQGRFPTEWLGRKVKEMRSSDGLKIVLEDDSWFLIRPSGTEPVLRTYAEFPKVELSKKSLANLSKILYDVLIKAQ